MVVDVSLDREHDNALLIFESMNATGLALSQEEPGGAARHQETACFGADCQRKRQEIKGLNPSI